MAKGKVRDKSKDAFWRRTVREQRQSGLTVRAFCRKHAVRDKVYQPGRGAAGQVALARP